MFKTMLAIFNNKDIRNRLLFTLAMLFIYRLGSAIVVPGIDSSQINLSSNSLLGLMSLLGGGSIQRMSIFALGVGPYITASIIIQLLSMDVIPYLSELAKEGKQGQQKLDKYTRYLGILMAILQSFFIVQTLQAQYNIVENPSFASYLFISILFSAGTMFLLWIGDQITTKGIGNGVSIIIFAGIVSDLPFTFVRIYQEIAVNGIDAVALVKYGAYLLMFLFIIAIVTIMQLATRRIPIQYTSSSITNKSKGDMNYLPLKINSASVIPVIFASALLQAPLIIVSWIDYEKYLHLAEILNFDKPLIIVFYAICIILFTFFYANTQVDPKKIAENFVKQNTYIPGVRPGSETRKYLSKVLNRITCLGALMLTFIAVIPYVLTAITKLNLHAAIGGTGIIIVVGIAIETHKQITSQLTQKSYKGFIGR